MLVIKKQSYLLQLYSEDFVKFRFTVFLAIIFILGSLSAVSAQVDSAIAQVTNSVANTTQAGGISGDGRFIVFESYENIATENPRNADANLEVFLFDYAQRRIFQITDTKSLLVNANEPPTTNTNIRVIVQNTRPVISNDGKWLALGSNATCNFQNSTTTIINGGNPGSFDPNITAVTNSSGEQVPAPCNTGSVMTPVNNLPNDGNTEMWFYRIPDVAPANLSLGAEIGFTDLSGGTFVQATNTLASLPPVAGTTTALPFIADDNRNASINDDGSYAAFVSNRDLEPCPTTPTVRCGNGTGFNNNEIFLAVRSSAAPNFPVTNQQITGTPRPTLQRPSSNNSPSISGNGLRIAFISNENDPVDGMSGGTNADFTEEIFYLDVNAAGDSPAGFPKVQVTNTVPASPGNVVNVLDFGKRISRDGRFIAFDSFADLEADGSPVQASFALYVFDANEPATAPNNDRFDRVGPRSDADSAATGGDLRRYPSFTDYTGRVPSTLVLETRLNINSAGTVPATASEGLNPNATRPAQVYSIPLNTVVNIPTPAPAFKRLTNLPTPSLILPTIRPLTTDSVNRIAFNLSRTEVGTGNFDLGSEVYYLLTPTETSQTAAGLNFSTGATRIPVVPSPVPTPSPTATPTATPTPSPSPSASPTATPGITAPAVQGVSPGMLAIVDVTTGFTQPVAAQTAVGSLQRSFTLPIELSGVTVTINGAASGVKTVSRRQVTFVVPPGTTPSNTPYPIVINNNGVLIKGTIVVVPTRPDVFSFNETPGPGGRARIFNATNRVLIREPFNVTTFRFRGSRRVPTVVRLFLTGVQGAQAQNFNIRLGGVPIPAANISAAGAIIREPGVFSIDFTLPPELDMDGDVPVVVTITAAGITYAGRLDDTTSFVRIL